MASLEALQKLEARASQAESLISFLKAEVSELQKKAEFCQKSLGNVYTQRFEEVVSENEDLKKEIEVWKTRLVTAEKQIGVIGCSVPVLTIPDSSCTTKKASTKEKPVESKKKERAKAVASEDKKIEKKSATDAGDDLPVDVRRLDIRVGRIINIKKHPAADTLYVEEVDLGENKTRTVVSGLVKYVPIEEMANRMVIVLCNLKPAKMRGITSEAMVLCASTPEKVEVLTPPAGSSPGDRVQVEGYPGEPDPILNPKKKIFETVAPDLKTDDKKVATYKGLPLTVSGKGVVTAESLTNVQIK